ncbi:MAG: hypothetical protein V1921_04475 [Candidatus Altiarchaeota archaeon]
MRADSPIESGNVGPIRAVPDSFVRILDDAGVKGINEKTLQKFVSETLPTFKGDVDFQEKAIRSISAAVQRSEGDVTLDVTACGIDGGAMFSEFSRGFVDYSRKAPNTKYGDKQIQINGLKGQTERFILDGKTSTYTVHGSVGTLLGGGPTHFGFRMGPGGSFTGPEESKPFGFPMGPEGKIRVSENGKPDTILSPEEFARKYAGAEGVTIHVKGDLGTPREYTLKPGEIKPGESAEPVSVFKDGIFTSTGVAGESRPAKDGSVLKGGTLTRTGKVEEFVPVDDGTVFKDGTVTRTRKFDEAAVANRGGTIDIRAQAGESRPAKDGSVLKGGTLTRTGTVGEASFHIEGQLDAETVVRNMYAVFRREGGESIDVDPKVFERAQKAMRDSLPKIDDSQIKPQSLPPQEFLTRLDPSQRIGPQEGGTIRVEPLPTVDAETLRRMLEAYARTKDIQVDSNVLRRNCEAYAKTATVDVNPETLMQNMEAFRESGSKQQEEYLRSVGILSEK